MTSETPSQFALPLPKKAHTLAAGLMLVFPSASINSNKDVKKEEKAEKQEKEEKNG